jgi:hypothetical protein
MRDGGCMHGGQSRVLGLCTGWACAACRPAATAAATAAHSFGHNPSLSASLPCNYSQTRLQVPIIAPVKHKRFEVEDKEAPATRYSPEFLGSLLSTPELIRNVAVVGHLHHGKTLVSGHSSAGRQVERGGVGGRAVQGQGRAGVHWLVPACCRLSALLFTFPRVLPVFPPATADGHVC